MNMRPDEILSELTGWLAWAGLENLSVQEISTAFCEKLVTYGIPLERMQIGSGTIHPDVRGFAYTWRTEDGLTEQQTFIHGDEADPAWFRSPGSHLLQHRQLFLTARLDDRTHTSPWFPLYDDLAAEGYVEYHTEVFPFGWTSTADHETDIGELGVISSWTTRQPDGFGRTLPVLRQLLPIFALALKSRMFGDMAETLLVTYVGQNAGQRILHGDVHRGDTRALQASIMLADLRGFTALSDRLSSSDLTALLNQYMERICGAVHDHGGEVLKFLGDGLLAVFDQHEKGDRERALAAAERALSDVAALNTALSDAGTPTMALDIALHAGEVAYGNIGAPGRLDFTIIGPAVNEAARMEAACGELDRSLLISDTFADGLADTNRLEPLGSHHFRGVKKARALFGLRPYASDL